MKKQQAKKWFTERFVGLFIIFVVLLSLLPLALQACAQNQLLLDVPMTETLDSELRDTLWPLLVTLIITLLGSLITTYVFLKEALDRMSDEKPYYHAVIRAYREATLGRLWWYSVAAIVLILVIVCLYLFLYFGNQRTQATIRFLIAVLYVAAVIAAAYILHMCIYIEQGLHRAAEKQLLASFQKISEFPLNSLLDIKQELQGTGLGRSPAMVWLQIEQLVSAKPHIDVRKFITRFAECEKLVFILADQRGSQLNPQSLYEQIDTAVEKGILSFKVPTDAGDIERLDAEANNWEDSPAFRKISECKRMLCLSSATFNCAFRFLTECRNLFQILLDTSAQEDAEAIERTRWYAELRRREELLADVFLYFWAGISIEISRILPKIEVFLPSGQFGVSNFYSVRFEDSAFRASLFFYTVFARSKLLNTNFSISSFDTCEFFSADSRDCSFSNTLFKNCSFRETIFDNVDFTGAEFFNCQMKHARFFNAILQNMTLHDVSFQKNCFVNSKLENITLNYHPAPKERPSLSFKNCDFSDSEINDIRLCLDNGQYPWHRYEHPAAKRLSSCLGERSISSSQKNTESSRQELLKIMDAFALPKNPFLGPSGNTECENADSQQKDQIWTCMQQEALISMTESLFCNTKMSAIRLFRANLEQSVFTGAQLNSAQLVCVYMTGCIMDGANLRRATLFGVVLRSVVLKDAILFESTCRLVNLEDASLQDLHASEADFQYCSFKRSDCSRIDLTRSKTRVSTFQDAILTEAELTYADFYDVIFDNCVAGAMLASYTSFQNCRLSNAYLAQSNFNYTVFESCCFALANFADSTVTGARFMHCDFKNSNFRRTYFIQAIFEDCDHLTPEIFEGCHFINTEFRGSNATFEDTLKNAGTEIIHSDE